MPLVLLLVVNLPTSLQVSKCEKFGYGCMVTQLASSAAGILELNNCGVCVAGRFHQVYTYRDHM